MAIPFFVAFSLLLGLGIHQDASYYLHKHRTANKDDAKLMKVLRERA